MKFSTIWETNHFGKQFSYGETGQPLKVQYPWILVATYLFWSWITSNAWRQNYEKRLSCVSINNGWHSYFLRWQELPKYQKREKKPKLYASYAIRSSAFVIDENCQVLKSLICLHLFLDNNYVRQIVFIYFWMIVMSGSLYLFCSQW